MVHGILQFTPSIAVCYVLHRCESLDIRCRESCDISFQAPFEPHGEGSANGPLRGKASHFVSPWRFPRRFLFRLPDATVDRSGRRSAGRGGEGRGFYPDARRRFSNVFAGFRSGFDNDPSAGSPTETLLRLLLPLNDKVQWTSRDVAGSEPLTSPRSEHFTGPFNR